MGRRPHVLIQEFFDRGSKLHDNSNRYEHTCKRCGEFFPKGRIDSLTTHLLRRCPNLTQPDRTWVIQQLQSDIARPPRPAKRSHAEAVQDIARPEERSEHADSSPFLHRSALETLAEVSGQHAFREDAQAGALTHPNQLQSNANTVAEAIAEQALLVQLQDHVELNSGVSASSDPTSNHPLQPERPLSIQHGFERSSEVNVPQVLTSAPRSVSSANTASRHLESTQAAPSLLDMQTGAGNNSGYQSFNMPLDLSFRMGVPDSDPDASWTQAATSNAIQSFGSLTMPHNDAMAGYGILASSTKQKPRGRFDDVRRKEVSKIRKQGACIRCRMLKKPCSGETPCKTCANVESARIWKGKCLRTRLSDEMTLWSRQYFQARAQGKLDRFAHGLHKDGTQGQLEVRFSPTSKPISLPVRRARPPGQDPEEPALQAKERGTDEADLWLLDADENTEKLLGTHATAAMHDAVNSQSSLMRDILVRTQELCTAPITRKPPVDLADGDQQRDTTRSSHSQQNDLPTNVLELWAATYLLTSDTFEKAALTVVSRPSPPPKGEPSPPPTAMALTSPNHDILRAQLSAALEAHCSKLSKTALNDLERRLLQRQQTSRSTTLLAALVLLGAVEHMADHLHSASPDQTAEPLRAHADSFAALFASLLRMRALPPYVRVGATGTPEGGGDGVAEWLDARAWAAKRDAEGGGGGEEAWEGRFVARVLLPEGETGRGK